MFQKTFKTEEALVSGCVRNDRRAQEALFRRFFPAMYAMCIRHMSDQDTAVEVVNTGFLQVFLKIHTYAFRGSLEGWIRRIVYHSIADHYRKNARYAHFLVLEEQAGSDNAENDGLQSCFEADILTAVGELPPATREVFRLYALEGYTHVEIAATLHISEGTSKWHLSTARQILRKYLEQHGYDSYTGEAMASSHRLASSGNKP